MTLHEEPPIVDIDEMLREQAEHEGRGTRRQWTVVVVGGIVGIGGLLVVLVATEPAIIALVTWIASSIQHAAQR